MQDTKTVTGGDRTQGPWFVVYNGNKIDIHVRDMEQRREFTVLSDVGSEVEARRIVAEHNVEVVEWLSR